MLSCKKIVQRKDDDDHLFYWFLITMIWPQGTTNASRALVGQGENLDF